MRERNQLYVLVNIIRNSRNTDSDTPRIPKLIAIFLGQSLKVMMDPKDILYEKVNTFFLQRPSLDLDDIPMFYALSNSGEHFEREVNWLLDIIIAGLNDPSVTSFDLN